MTDKATGSTSGSEGYGLTVARYGRFWAVYDNRSGCGCSEQRSVEKQIAGQLVCVTVYKKGAREVVRQEARVEVTYVLERDDMDVPLLASVKAAEVQHALCAARQQLHRQQEAPDVRPVPSPANGHGSDFPFKPGASAANSAGTHSTGSARANGAAGKQGNGYSRSTATPPPAAPEDQADCITQAQKLAIRSMFTRLSMNEPQARALVHEQCGKWALEGLTKDEAKQLLHSLQQGEREHTGRD